MAFSTKIRQGCESLPRSNTLAYYENRELRTKRFNNIGPRSQCYKTIFYVGQLEGKFLATSADIMPGSSLTIKASKSVSF
jgi:hypothetical protein